ncbi:hypothetical protein DFJ43DRAFT_583329 [Lentinula guzmanii]|uniref:Secreted protein n=1 Tax=Lentinula guzmanii TaxID=2804957 RepID=A0AA38J1G3_9AGAR|nr:hypothetical protein DFJ43DRAFT_1228668 [Lentinula guzmanii]KAJ3725016.1 hypothetical protein DFJ43DRAFT_583329 [Lentinula guzmanii]
MRHAPCNSAISLWIFMIHGSLGSHFALPDGLLGPTHSLPFPKPPAPHCSPWMDYLCLPLYHSHAMGSWMLLGTQELVSTVFWQRVILSAPCHILMTPSLTLLVGDHRHHNRSSGPYACFCTCDTVDLQWSLNTLVQSNLQWHLCCAPFDEADLLIGKIWFVSHQDLHTHMCLLLPAFLSFVSSSFG